MSLVIYNTLTNIKEKFLSIEPNNVKMYVCGPTVYNFLHIGNFRGPIFYNMLANWLEKSGYNVTYIFNYTDVDDKIINSARDNGVAPHIHANQYIKEFEQDYNALELRKHDHNPRVTEHIDNIIDIVKKLISNGNAYEIEGEVFYDTRSFANYGQLSGKNIDQLEAGSRVEVDPRKKHPSDFVLWKPAKSGEPSWKSPWSDGRPGWHIECTAMIHSLLGDSIDIHGGGIDLIFPHHENEIAQGEGAHCGQYCKYWIHNEFINIDNEKMSKSLGNFITGRDFMIRYHPEVLKYVFLTAHYRSVININDDKIHSSFSGLERIYKSLKEANEILSLCDDGNSKVLKSFEATILNASNKIKKAFDDDFNTPEVFAQIFTVVRTFNEMKFSKKLKDPFTKQSILYFLKWIKSQGEILSLFLQPPSQFLEELDNIVLKIKGLDRSTIDILIKERENARASKDFEKSDQLRDQLAKMSIILLDGDTRTKWTIDKNCF